MTNKQFDDIIKSKMSGLSDGKTSADWDQFSELLKQSEGFSEVDFDKKVADKVKGHQAGYSESHWALLKARLEREEFIRTRLYFSKLAEIAAVFLFLFASTNYAGLKYDFGTDTDPAMFAHLYEDVKGEHRDIQKEILKTQNQSPTVASNNKSNRSFNNPSGKIQSLIEITPTISASANVINQGSIVQSLELKNHPTIATIAKLSDMISDDENLLALVDVQSLNANQSLLPKEEMEFIYAAHVNEDTKTKYEIKPYFGMGVANTRSPFDEVYKIDAINIYSVQKKAGVAFAAGSGNLKIATGLEWNHNKYQPVQVEEVYGSFRDGIKKISLKDISLDVAKVPIGVKYDFVRKKENSNHSFYVGANVGINAIMHAKYNIHETSVPIEDYRDIQLSTNRSSTPEAKLYTKDLGKGILQGGDALSNLFIDTSLELGFEKRISKNANIAISANYSKYLGTQGLGPNEDRYDNLTFNVGVNYLMN